VKIEINVDSAAVQRTIERLGERARDLTPAFRGIGADIVADAQTRFKRATDPYGVPWKPLSRRTVAARRKGSSAPLLDTGRLRNSVSYRLVPNGVEVGTNVRYAAIHQFGGTINFAARSQRVRLRQVKVTRKDGTSYLATRFAKDSHKRAADKWGTNATGWAVKIPARSFLATQTRGLPREYGEIIRDQLALHFARAAA
jgi:phage virion morphogenesis protein